MIPRQFQIYVCVGLLSTGVDIATMEALIRFGVHYGAAVTLGFAVGLVVNYVFHARITFRASSTIATIAKYGDLVFTNYLFTLVCVFATEHWFGSVLLGKLLSLPVVAVNGFLWSRYWVFK